jgi:hypothetical protein
LKGDNNEDTSKPIVWAYDGKIYSDRKDIPFDKIAKEKEMLEKEKGQVMNVARNLQETDAISKYGDAVKGKKVIEIEIRKR